MSTEASTLELLDAWHLGDQQSLVWLIERHVPWLRTHVRRRMTARMRHFETSEDVVQTVLYHLLRYTPPFRPENEAQFRALIARAVYNRLCELNEYATAQMRDPDRLEPMPSQPSRIHIGISSASHPDRLAIAAEEEMERREERSFLALAMHLIDPEDQRIIHLHDFQQTPFSQIGSVLAISEEGARSRYRRALVHLRNQVNRLRSGQLQDLLQDLEPSERGPTT